MYKRSVCITIWKLYLDYEIVNGRTSFIRNLNHAPKTQIFNSIISFRIEYYVYVRVRVKFSCFNPYNLQKFR